MKKNDKKYTDKDIDELMIAPIELWHQRMMDYSEDVTSRNLPSGLI